jgi:hypothetical protein
LSDGKTDQLVLTFDELLRRTPLAGRMREMVQLLEKHYKSPVDTEFTVYIDTSSGVTKPEVQIYLLQCRPQSHLKEMEAQWPQALFPDDIVFSTRRMVPRGTVNGIRYVLFVTPECYYVLPTPAQRVELGRMIGRLNAELSGTCFLCVGPGRWGTNNPDLGLNVGYSDIYNTRALVELTGPGIGTAPDPSFGTHFFQDLVEANIFPLAIYLGDEDVAFNRDFFYNSPNSLPDNLSPGKLPPGTPQDEALRDCLRLIEVASYRPGYHLDLIMDDEQGRAVAFLSPD